MRRLLFIVVFILPLLACSVFTPRPTNTPTRPPTALPTRTLVPSATITPVTPLPSSTLTVTPPPTLVPTLPPSPTPRGYTLNQTAGFSVVLPLGWTVANTTNNSLVAVSKVDQLAFQGASGATDTTFTFDAALKVVQAANAGWFATSKLVSQTKVTLEDGTQGDEGVLQGKDTNGTSVSAFVILARSSTKDYLFIIYGPSSAIQKRADTLKALVSSIQLLGVQLYGLDRTQTLVMLGGDPGTDDLDPARTTHGAGGSAGLLYSGLVSLTPQLQIAPDLAESWKVSSDGLVYTFTLRGGISFQSGKPITAGDFKNSWERAADPKTGSTTAATYLGDIKGFLDKVNGKATEISGVKVIDDHTLQVTIDAPKPYFLAKLSYPSSFVVDQDSINASPSDWEFKPNASGPYQLKDYRQGELLVLERNAAYHTPAGIPYIAILIYQAGTSLGLYQDGTIDIAPLPYTDAKLVQAPDNPLNKELHSATTLCTSLIQMNNTLPPMDDPNVRKAFALAVDTQRLGQITNGGMAPVATSILPPAMPGHSSGLAVDAFDPAAARTALAASKYAGNLPKITLTVSGFANQQNSFIDALVNMWQTNLGVSVQVEYLDPQDYTREAVNQHGQMVDYGWCADYPDPQNFLDILYHTGSDFNVAGYSNPAVDALLEKAQVEQDTAKRLALYQQAETMLLQDYAAIPIQNDASYELVKPSVKGYVQPVMDVRYLNLLTLSSP
jgi:oligopeptide transport system substrate-binding protein